MASEEKYGFRGKHYSQWHRTLGYGAPMIDVDWVEWCRSCGDILAVVETVCHVQLGQKKNTSVTERMAQLMNRPAYLVFYGLNTNETGIEYFLVQQVWPQKSPLKYCKAREWGDCIKQMHTDCDCRRLPGETVNIAVGADVQSETYDQPDDAEEVDEDENDGPQDNERYDGELPRFEEFLVLRRIDA